MTPHKIASVIEGLIPLSAGVYLTLMGYGVIGEQSPPDPTKVDRTNWFKFGGPFLIVFAFFQMARGFFE